MEMAAVELMRESQMLAVVPMVLITLMKVMKRGLLKRQSD
jgi:hypothetical protein